MEPRERNLRNNNINSTNDNSPDKKINKKLVQTLTAKIQFVFK